MTIMHKTGCYVRWAGGRVHSACREESLQVSLALALGSNPRVRIGIRGAEEDHTPSALDLHAFFVSVMHAIGHRSSILNMQYKPLINSLQRQL